jgi:hypothetical protein
MKLEEFIERGLYADENLRIYDENFNEYMDNDDSCYIEPYENTTKKRNQTIFSRTKPKAKRIFKGGIRKGEITPNKFKEKRDKYLCYIKTINNEYEKIKRKEINDLIKKN